jgi:hypothetical protein
MNSTLDKIILGTLELGFALLLTGRATNIYGPIIFSGLNYPVPSLSTSNSFNYYEKLNGSNLFYLGLGLSAFGSALALGQPLLSKRKN